MWLIGLKRWNPSPLGIRNPVIHPVASRSSASANYCSLLFSHMTPDAAVCPCINWLRWTLRERFPIYIAHHKCHELIYLYTQFVLSLLPSAPCQTVTGTILACIAIFLITLPILGQRILFINYALPYVGPTYKYLHIYIERNTCIIYILCVYTCIHNRTHIYMYALIHTCIHAYVRTCRHTGVLISP